MRTLILLLLSVAAATAGELEAEVARLVRPYLDSETVVGMSVGVVRGDVEHLAGFGRGAPDGDTVYEIGSISKVFTGILLAGMVADTSVKLDQPVASLLPDSVRIPRFGDRAITLLDLTTHTSALPRMPINFKPKDMTNPYADYTVAQMYEFLGSCRLAYKPGTKVAYSNLGVGLLGHALALKAGVSYEALLHERITQPLEMTSTAITLNESMRKRLAPGHDANGKPAANWDIPTLAGAGAIRSTARDMVRWLRANFSDDEILANARAKHFDAPRSMGLGWVIAGDGAIRWHNGQTGGYHSYAGVLVEKKIAVVILTNTATGAVDQLGGDLIRMLAGQKVEPAKLRRVVKVDPKLLQEYVGMYRLAPTFAITVTLEKGQLMIQATNQPKFAVYPESPTKFFLRVVDAQISFAKKNGVWGLTLHQNGRDTPGVRE